MIRRIEAWNYRCLRYVDTRMDDFHILVGPNASGKSTFLDVIAFVRDVVLWGPEQAIKLRATSIDELFWNGEGSHFELAFEVKIPANLIRLLEKKNYRYCRYELAVGTIGPTQEFGILNERLWLLKTETKPGLQREFFPDPPPKPQGILFSHKRASRMMLINKTLENNDIFYSETGKFDVSFKLGPQKSALANLPEDEEKFPVSIWFKKIIQEGVANLNLNSEDMRRPAPPGMPRKFRPDGSNICWVIRNLQEEFPEKYDKWIQHIQTALPEFESLEVIERPEDKHIYLLLTHCNGLKTPSWLISDGTLRMMVLTLLPYLPKLHLVYLIEEPENGIHPRAVETVYQSLSSVYDGQVLLATHSPILLNLANPDQIFCFAKSSDGAVDIVRGSQHPALKEWRKGIDLAHLFASGVLG